MPRPIWTGSIRFQLVNVPLRLITATPPNLVRSHQLPYPVRAALRAKDDALGLSTMLDDDEVVPLDSLEGVPEGVELSDREVGMAEQLVTSLATAFEPAKYTDTYRQKVLEMIEAKADGQ